MMWYYLRRLDLKIKLKKSQANAGRVAWVKRPVKTDNDLGGWDLTRNEAQISSVQTSKM